MKAADRRQTIILIVGALAALLVAILGLVAAEVPSAIRAFIGSPTAWAIVVTSTLPILVLLSANQISTLLKSSSDREDIIEDVVKHLPASSTVIHFETSASAMEYLIENVARATHVFNTRLSLRSVEESDPENVRLVERMDKAVWSAIQRGMEYSWLVSTEYAPLAVELHRRRQTYAKNHNAVGTYCYWVLKESEIPFFHFIVHIYPDHRELMLGWALTSTRSFGERVFLIRDERLVNYFRTLFDTYCSAVKDAASHN